MIQEQELQQKEPQDVETELTMPSMNDDNPRNEPLGTGLAQFQDTMDSDPETMVPDGLAEHVIVSLTKATSFGDDEDNRKEKERCRLKCFRNLGKAHPRMFALTCGLLLPLLSLMVMAAVCGYPLALLESPLELQQNDLLLAEQMTLMVETALYTNLTQRLPSICLQLHFSNWTVEDFLGNVSGIKEIVSVGEQVLDFYKLNETTDGNWTADVDFVDFDVNEFNISSEEEEAIIEQNFSAWEAEINETKDNLDDMWGLLFLDNPEMPNDLEIVVNASELSEFVASCGVELSPVIDKMFFSLSSTANKALSSDLSFAWTRCPDDYNEPLMVPQTVPPSVLLQYLLSMNPDLRNVTLNSHSYDSQAAYYRSAWEMDRVQKYQVYYNMMLPDDASRNDTTWRHIWAFQQSVINATGSGRCSPNIPAATWFWFTVMTTIGYGNTSPVSLGGKAMVFTLGFISIVLFGAVSTRAAYVITSLFDDFLIRTKLRRMLPPLAELGFWGGIYFAWLVAIAAHYIWWQQDRLGEDGVTGLGLGYWFAFVSTTTVGFGDYYLAPEVIVVTDCIVYPVLFLLGFSFLAAFLSKLSDFITTPFKDGPALVEHFQKMDEINEAEASRIDRIQEHIKDGGNVAN